MSIVGGLDIHRKQLTFDYLDTVTGQVTRGQVTPADREHLRAWLARFAGRDDDQVSVRGVRTGCRYVVEEVAAAGTGVYPGRALPTPRSPAAVSGTPRPTRPTPGTCGSCWPRAYARVLGLKPVQVLEIRALLEAYQDPGREHTAWVQRIHAVFFHQGAPALGEIIRTAADLRAVKGCRCSRTCRRPGSSRLSMVALAMMTCLTSLRGTSCCAPPGT